METTLVGRDAKVFDGRPRRRWPPRVWVLAAALAALAFWTGSERRPCGPAYGTGLDGQPARPAIAQRGLRLGTFNIHGGKGRDGRLDLERTAACLRGLDLVGLNEVRGAWFWEDSNQAELLGGQLDLAWLFAPTEERWWHHRFGNGALTSLRVTHWQQIPLPRLFGKSFRNLVLLGVRHGGRTIHVVVTHLDRSDDRERLLQLRAATEFFLSLAEPAVLMGDLNTSADEPEMQRLLGATGVRDPLAEILGDRTPRRIDWILVRGLRTIDAGIRDTGASDHPHVWAEVEPAPAATDVLGSARRVPKRRLVSVRPR